MNVLLQLNNPYGIGADRWIVQGYRDALEDLGHRTALLTAQDDPRNVFRKFLPDLFFTSTNIVVGGGTIMKAIAEFRKEHALRVFMNIGEDFEQYRDLLNMVRDGVVDVFYSAYAPEVMAGCEAVIGKPLLFVPLAANHKVHFPVSPDERYASDICFIGARLSTKRRFFERVLLPLAKRYHVRISGAGWDVRDTLLHAGSAFGRMIGAVRFGGWMDNLRLRVSPEEERLIYASSKICMNIHEYYPDGRSKNVSNEREFKIPACGGFQMSDPAVGLERSFVPGEEIVIVGSLEEWIPRVQFYLAHPEERRRIQRRGTDRALREHTYRHRVARFLEAYGAFPS